MEGKTDVAYGYMPSPRSQCATKELFPISEIIVMFRVILQPYILTPTILHLPGIF